MSNQIESLISKLNREKLSKENELKYLDKKVLSLTQCGEFDRAGSVEKIKPIVYKEFKEVNVLIRIATKYK